MEGFQMVINLLVMPMFFLIGAMYPVKALPGWLKNIVYIDPLSYGVDALRDFHRSSCREFSSLA
jgi:ABC-2 type transport system permease protein